MRLFAAALALASGIALAHEPEIQRAVIQRDQQSAEFAARARAVDTTQLEQLHARQLMDAGRPLHPDPALARQLHDYQRQKMADERVLVLPPPAVTLAKPVERPLPLPGGPRPGVELVPADSGRN